MNIKRKREFKSRLFGEFARIGKAFASPHRLQIIEVLAQGERTVEQLAGEFGVPVANVSQHLQVLRSTGLVSVRREGLYAHYSLADEPVFRLWQAVREVGRTRLAEIDLIVAHYLQDRDRMEAVDAIELRRRIRDDAVVVLDVRPRHEYEAGHIASARCIPIAELEKRLGELPEDRDVVAYCRGPYCVYADEAVRKLLASGFRASRLADGFPDWKARGFPVGACGGQ